MFKNNKKFLILLFIFAFIFRIIFFYFVTSQNNNYWTSDSSAYHETALKIASGYGIADINNQPDFYRLPGYSLFLATCYKLFNQNKIVALIIQILLSCFIPILIFFLSLSLFSTNILLAKLAAIYSIFHMGFVIFSGLIMSETLFIIFFLLFLIYFYKHFDNKKIFLAGLFLGLASYFRPVGQYVILLSILILILSNLSIKKKIYNSLLLFVGWFLIVFLWLLRNFVLTGCICFHTLPGKHFLNHTACYIVMHRENLTYDQAKTKLSQELTNIIKQEESKLKTELNSAQLCVLAEKLSYKYIYQEPKLFFIYSLTNMLKTAFLPFSEELLFMQTKNNFSIKYKIKNFLLPKLNNLFLNFYIYLEILFLIFLLLGFILFIINYLLSFEYLKYAFLLKTVSFIFLFIFLSLASGYARLRLPVEPLIFILSISYWLNFFKNRKLCLIKNF
ncbi:MAG: hypothetical protein WC436_00785 [Candidatus Babeliales bacterium]